MRTMANPDDPVTHEELAELLSEKLDPIISLVSNLPGAAKVDPPADDDDDDSDDTPRFSLREMESYAERQVKKAVRDLAGKSPKEKPAPKVKDDDAKDDEPKGKVEPPPAPTPEPTPDPAPGKKSKSERFWGK